MIRNGPLAFSSSYIILLFLGLVYQISMIEGYSFGIGVSGCKCMGSCERTVDSPFRPWCYTSDRGIPAPITDSSSSSSSTRTNTTLVYCGRYSVSRQAYWDECIIVNSTGTIDQVVQLQTFEEMWSYMTISVVGSMALMYTCIGCVSLCWVTPGSGLAVLLPLSAGLFGACQGFFIGAMFAAIVAFIYLSIPYAIDARVAISLGIGLSILLAYTSLGRHYTGSFRSKRGSASSGGALHASEYVD